MTTPCNKQKLSEQLWNNSLINKVEFNAKEFNPTNIGHGIFVKTIGEDVLLDLRLSTKRPFLGHSHPILIQFNYGMLSNTSIENQYSIPKTEFTRMIETFQRVSFKDVLKENFKITYHNVVIEINEDILSYDLNIVKKEIKNLISKNSDTFFWIVERDIVGINPENIYFMEELTSNPEYSKRVHLVINNYFVSSIWLQSTHLFASDNNEQLYLSLSKYYNEIVAHKEGKNQIDFKIIDDFLNVNLKSPYQRIGRYLMIKKNLDSNKLVEKGILASYSVDSEHTIFNFPIACTKSELLDTLKRILSVLT